MKCFIRPSQNLYSGEWLLCTKLHIHIPPLPMEQWLELILSLRNLAFKNQIPMWNFRCWMVASWERPGSDPPTLIEENVFWKASHQELLREEEQSSGIKNSW